MEPVFQRLYSYIFDTENAAYSAANDMDRQVPSAIFIVNFDKVWSAIIIVDGLSLSSPLILQFTCYFTI